MPAVLACRTSISARACTESSRQNTAPAPSSTNARLALFTSVWANGYSPSVSPLYTPALVPALMRIVTRTR